MDARYDEDARGFPLGDGYEPDDLEKARLVEMGATALDQRLRICVPCLDLFEAGTDIDEAQLCACRGRERPAHVWRPS